MRLRSLPRLQTGIRTRLVLWYTAVLAVILISFSAFTYFSLSQSLYAELDSSLQEESDLVSQTVRISRDSNPPAVTLSRVPADFAATVFGGSGRSLARLSGSELLQSNDLMVASAESGTPHFGTDVIRGERWRVYTRPLSRNGQLSAVLEVGEPLTDIDHTLGQRLELLLLTVPLTLILATGGGIFLSGRAMGPIARIIQTVRLIQAEDLSERVDDPHSRDEVGQLVSTFNQMLDRLDGAFRRERRFTGDAAHELRSPLAAIKNQIEVTLERPRESEEYRALLGEIDLDIDRMAGLIQTMLALARADGDRPEVADSPVDLVDVVSDAIQQVTPAAANRPGRIRVEASEPIAIEGDRGHLRQLVANLIDNALSYSLPGTGILIRIWSRDGEAAVSVIDQGPGISAEHLPHIFERFYRVDRSRSRAVGHYGLGLALCAAIAREHHGRIEVDSREGIGSTFTFWLARSAGMNQLVRHSAEAEISLPL